MVQEINKINNRKTSREFTISTKYFKGAQKIDELYIEGNNLYQKDKDFILYKGELLEPSFALQNIFKNIGKEGPSSLINLKGEFIIAYYNATKKKIYIINDKLGLEPLYYHINNDKKPRLFISSDFWRMVYLIDPTEKDLDTQAMKELVLFHKSLFWRTILKDVNFFPAANIGAFDIINFKYKITEYWDFSFTPNKKMTLDEAAERLDQAINDVINKIIELNGKSITYGVGISGGLDTRIIPYYLQKNGIKNIVSFTIGEKNPHKLLLSRDHKNAREIAKHYQIKHHACNYNAESFEEKIVIDVRYHPLRSSNILKVLSKSVPEFNILITGGYGTIVGGHKLFNNMNKLTTTELGDTMAASFSRIKPRKHILDKIFTIIKNTIFGPSKEVTLLERTSIKGIISEEEFDIAVKKLNSYILYEKNKGKNNLDIFMKYHLLLSDKYGAFESLSGTRRSYSIYFPTTLEEISNWKIDFVVGRKVFEYLIFKKINELSKIPGQNRKIPIYFKFKKINYYHKKYHKITSFLIYYIRGSGLKYNTWIKKKEFLRFSRNILYKNNDYYNKIFEVDSILNNIDDLNELVFENLVKLKYMLDIILSKKYVEWFKVSDHG